MKRHQEPKRAFFSRKTTWLVILVAVVLIGGAVMAGNGQLTTLFGGQQTTQKTQPKPKPKPKPVKLTAYEKKVAHKYQLTPQTVAVARKTAITAIGDSVMVDVTQELRQVFQKVMISGAVGRQFYELPGLTRQLKAQGKLGDNIVVNLGTNGPPEQKDINQFLKIVGGKRQVYWINTRVPTQKWEGTTNKMVAKTASKHENVHVVDWYGLSKTAGQSNWFAADGFHLQTKGANAYVALLAKEVAKVAG